MDKINLVPTNFVSETINACLYSFRIGYPLKTTSIEKETFPVMAKDKKLYSKELDGDGQPVDLRV